MLVRFRLVCARVESMSGTDRPPGGPSPPISDSTNLPEPPFGSTTVAASVGAPHPITNVRHTTHTGAAAMLGYNLRTRQTGQPHPPAEAAPTGAHAGQGQGLQAPMVPGRHSPFGAGAENRASASPTVGFGQRSATPPPTPYNVWSSQQWIGPTAATKNTILLM